jgi:signal transduction histidine kinase
MRKKQNAMQMSVEEKVSTVERGALLCVADAGLAEELTRELKLCAHVGSVRVATNLPDLIERMEQDSPYLILLASAERQGEILRMVAEGEVEFVARHGDFIPLAACLVERRLRWAQRSGMGGESPWAEMPEDVAEIFRHQINNPLTGILGNAELLLSHGVRLPAADTQRLQTGVDLAVRLRETIRRLSDSWYSQTRVP